MPPRSSAITVRAPSSAGAMSARRLGQMAASGARRTSLAAVKAAASEKHTITALVTAAGLGYIEKNRVQVPHLNALGVDGTVGLGLWIAGRYTKNPMLMHAATGALACAIKGAVVSGAVGGTSGTPQGAVQQGTAAAAAAAQQQQAAMGNGGGYARPAGVMGGAF